MLGQLLSNDVPDAGVQEHVLVLQERKEVGSQVSDRDLLVAGLTLQFALKGPN